MRLWSRLLFTIRQVVPIVCLALFLIPYCNELIRKHHNSTPINVNIITIIIINICGQFISSSSAVFPSIFRLTSLQFWNLKFLVVFLRRKEGQKIRFWHTSKLSQDSTVSIRHLSNSFPAQHILFIQRANTEKHTHTHALSALLSFNSGHLGEPSST